ncbi:MAG: N-acetylglucosamine-6-phosphate deacetylase [Succinivibrio sp.]
MKFINGRIFDSNTREFVQKILCTDNDLITDDDKSGTVIDLKGKRVIPGLIDTHFHGAANHDFMEGSMLSLEAISRFEASCGVTSICPATMTMPEDEIERACLNAYVFKEDVNCSRVEGIYMEGPYVSQKKAGAQNLEYIKNADTAFVEYLQNKTSNLIKCVVVSPETDGAYDVIEKLSKTLTVSLGHTDCDYETAKNAFFKGASRLTHMFNAMNPLHHRKPGPVVAAFDDKKVCCELICDGVHIDPSIIRISFTLFKDRIIMISDSMMLTDGRAQSSDKTREGTLGGQKVTVKGNLATLSDNTIAGSVTTLTECLDYAVRVAGIDFSDAVIACTKTPAKSIGIYDRVGSLEVGKRADFLILDDNSCLPSKVVLRGRIIDSIFDV